MWADISVAPLEGNCRWHYITVTRLMCLHEFVHVFTQCMAKDIKTDRKLCNEICPFLNLFEWILGGNYLAWQSGRNVLQTIQSSYEICPMTCQLLPGLIFLLCIYMSCSRQRTTRSSSRSRHRVLPKVRDGNRVSKWQNVCIYQTSSAISSEMGWMSVSVHQRWIF